MTKQEEIREGMRQIQLGVRDGDEVLVLSDKAIDGVLSHLHSQRCVLKVAEIEEHLAEGGADSDTYSAYGVGASWERDAHMFKAFKRAGYVAVEPLIEVK